MTLVIGVRCGDGIVIGADSIATYATPNGEYTVEQKMDSKVHKVDDNMLYAFSGDIGLGQDVRHSVSKSWEKNKSKSKENIRKNLSKAVVEPVKEYAERSASVAALMRTASVQDPVVTSLIAYVAKGQPALIHYNLAGHPEEITRGLTFETIGSGKPYADPFLAFVKRVAWDDRQPRTVKQGIVGVLWALRYVSDSNSSIGVGGPFSIGVLEKNKDEWKASVLEEERLGLYKGAIDSAERSLEEELNKLEPESESSIPPRLPS